MVMVIRNGCGDLLMVASKGLYGMFSSKTTKLFVAILGLQLASQMGNILSLEIDVKDFILYHQASDDYWLIEAALLDEACSFF